MKRGKPIILAVLVVTVVGSLLVGIVGRPLWQPVYVKLTGGRTLQEAIDQYGPDAEARLTARFDATGAAYPPDAITLIGLKEEKLLELWATNMDGEHTLIHRYPVLGASGGPGPKLREGDRQVPEGLYRIEGLNPNSSYHLSMKVDYPNAFDRRHAEAEGRDRPGTNIFIHGKSASVGCLAMGDPAIEDLFVLVHRVGLEQVRVLLVPRDPREQTLVPKADDPPWTAGLYAELEEAVSEYAP